MTSFRLSMAAQQDIREIRVFSKERFGIAATRDYIAGIRARFAFLRARPLAGSAQEDLAPALRALPYRSHRIYYRVRDDEVLVVRILHQSQDAQRHIPS
ncbi:type II toxin-antitoxin system RelE/ParE family toxin [Sphingomonas sp. MMS24-JH45]